MKKILYYLLEMNFNAKIIDLKYITLNKYKERLEKLYKFRNQLEKVLLESGEKLVNMINDYYNIVINEIKGTVDPIKDIKEKKILIKKPIEKEIIQKMLQNFY